MIQFRRKQITIEFDIFDNDIELPISLYNKGESDVVTYLKRSEVVELVEFLQNQLMQTTDQEFVVGDKVVIIKPGEIYAIFSDQFKKFGFRNTQRNDEPKEYYNLSWKIINGPEKHLSDPTTLLCGIESNQGHQLVIGLEGIKKVYK